MYDFACSVCTCVLRTRRRRLKVQLCTPDIPRRLCTHLTPHTRYIGCTCAAPRRHCAPNELTRAASAKSSAEFVRRDFHSGFTNLSGPTTVHTYGRRWLLLSMAQGNTHRTQNHNVFGNHLFERCEVLWRSAAV